MEFQGFVSSIMWRCPILSLTSTIPTVHHWLPTRIFYRALNCYLIFLKEIKGKIAKDQWSFVAFFSLKKAINKYADGIWFPTYLSLTQLFIIFRVFKNSKSVPGKALIFVHCIVQTKHQLLVIHSSSNGKECNATQAIHSRTAIHEKAILHIMI